MSFSVNRDQIILDTVFGRTLIPQDFRLLDWNQHRVPNEHSGVPLSMEGNDMGLSRYSKGEIFRPLDSFPIGSIGPIKGKTMTEPFCDC